MWVEQANDDRLKPPDADERHDNKGKYLSDIRLFVLLECKVFVGKEAKTECKRRRNEVRRDVRKPCRDRETKRNKIDSSGANTRDDKL